AVFLLGMNDGVFPRAPSTEGLINDRDRLRLEGMGLALRDTAPAQLDMERLLVYRSMNAASHRLFLSWARRGASGEELLPSPWIAWLRERFPALEERDTLLLSGMERLEGESTGFGLLCETKPHSALHASLREYFEGREEYRARLEALDRVSRSAPFYIDGADAAGALFPSSMTLSASRADSYARCPFSYYCRYGLRAEPRRRADFDARFRGSAVHGILERLFRETGVENLLAMDAARRGEKLGALMEEYAAAYLSAEGISERVRYLYRRLRGILAQVLERLLEEFRASAFRPVAYELAVDRDRELRPREIPLEGGGTLRMRGKIDRVDCAEVGGKRYFRVIDYKSGGKGFALDEVYDGLNLQMLVYLFSVWESGSPAFAGALPAGILYEYVSDPVLADKSREADNIAAKKQQNNCADGMLLEDADVLYAMEEGASGIYLPAWIEKDAIEGKMISLGALGQLKGVVDGLLRDMAHQLQAGKIPARPYQKEGSDEPACKFCDYQSVCGHEPGDPVKRGRKLEHKEALARLEP
ncbi:MAG: PD-(D/E)XK nuclease family protein, partial [Oscillospiraceae bacterium]|nr:PD-(D/E)XK nuclease family protein [Oscillospiraceae bacterium]